MLEKNDNTINSCFTDTLKKCFGGKHCSDLVSPLSKRCKKGRIRICKVTGDREICGRMASMGVYPGVEADIICSGRGSRCILKLNGSTVSLDEDVSENILVTSL